MNGNSRPGEIVERALIESAFRFAEALVTIEGSFVRVNDALCELIGYSAGELAELRLRQITHPEDVELGLEDMHRLLDGEISSYEVEKRFLHRSGRVVWGDLHVSLVRSDDGTPTHFVAQIQNVTERKAAEEALAQSEERFRSAFDAAPIGMALTGPDGRFLSVNEALCAMHGYSSDELLEMRWQEVTHPDDVAMDESAMRKLIAGEVDSIQLDKPYLHKDGHVVWGHLSVSVARGSDGVPLHFVAQIQDIGEQKRAHEAVSKSEARLMEAERRYRTLVEQLPMAMYIRQIDTTNPNLYASPQIERLLGYPQEEWLTDAGLLERIIHPDDRDRVIGESEILRETGTPFRGEYRYFARDGSEVWVQDETYLVVDEDGTPEYVQGYLLDITERKRAEQERDRLRDKLLHAQKLEAVGQLAGAIVHDFNNTLTAIRGYGELLEAGLPGDGPFRRYAEEIRKTAEGGSALPRQLLAFARKQPLETTILSLNEVVADSCRLLGPLLGEHIALSWEPGPPVEVVGDRVQLGQALLNLALNARDAMPDGGELSVATRCETVGPQIAARHRTAPGEYAVISMRDTGTGMDAETLQHVFEPFFTTKEEGTGLGLATLYGMVRQSGGSSRSRANRSSGRRSRSTSPARKRRRDRSCTSWSNRSAGSAPFCSRRTRTPCAASCGRYSSSRGTRSSTRRTAPRRSLRWSGRAVRSTP